MNYGWVSKTSKTVNVELFWPKWWTNLIDSNLILIQSVHIHNMYINLQDISRTHYDNHFISNFEGFNFHKKNDDNAWALLSQNCKNGLTLLTIVLTTQKETVKNFFFIFEELFDTRDIFPSKSDNNSEFYKMILHCFSLIDFCS